MPARNTIMGRLTKPDPKAVMIDGQVKRKLPSYVMSDGKQKAEYSKGEGKTSARQVVASQGITVG